MNKKKQENQLKVVKITKNILKTPIQKNRHIPIGQIKQQQLNNTLKNNQITPPPHWLAVIFGLRQQRAANPQSSFIGWTKKWHKNILQSCRFQYWLVKKQIFSKVFLLLFLLLLFLAIITLSLLPTLVSELKKQLLDGYKPFTAHMSETRKPSFRLPITSESDKYVRYDSPDKSVTTNGFLSYLGFNILNNAHLFEEKKNKLLKNFSLPTINSPIWKANIFFTKWASEKDNSGKGESSYVVNGQTFATYNYDLNPSQVIKKISDPEARSIKKSWQLAHGRTIDDGSQYIHNEQNPNSLNLYELFATNTYFKQILVNGVKYSPFYAFTNNKNYASTNVEKAISKLYLTIAYAIRASLGGLSLNNYVISQLTYLDGVSFLYNKIYDYPNLIFTSQQIATFIAGILLSGPLNTVAGHKVFDKYVSSSGKLLGIKLGFSSLLADIVYFFTPTFVSHPILDVALQIQNEFIRIYNKLKKDKLKKDKLKKDCRNSVFSIINSKYWINNLLKNKNFRDGEHYSLNFGTLPYNPKTDELYTHLFVSTIYHYPITFDGYPYNSRFWTLHPNAKKALDDNGAYTEYGDNAHSKGRDNLGSGISKDDPMPICINQRTIHDYPKWTVGSIVTLNGDKVGVANGNKITNFVVPIYCKVVAITNNYGQDSIYTARQEANSFVFERVKSTTNNNNRAVTNLTIKNPKDEVYLYGIPGQTNPHYAVSNTDVKRFPNGPNSPYSITQSLVNSPNGNVNVSKTIYKPSSIYGDGLGYFNSVNFTQKNASTAIQAVTTNLNSYNGKQDFNVKGVGHMQYISTNIFDESILLAAVQNIIQLLLYFLIIGAGLIFFAIIIIFIMSQKMIIRQNMSSFAMLKILGYSTRNILLSTTSFYLVMGIVGFCLSLFFYGTLTKLLFLIVSRLIPSSIILGGLPMKFNWISFAIYLVIICGFFLLFIYSSLATIRKIRFLNTI